MSGKKIFNYPVLKLNICISYNQQTTQQIVAALLAKTTRHINAANLSSINHDLKRVTAPGRVTVFNNLLKAEFINQYTL
jgi:hypothetical protein